MPDSKPYKHAGRIIRTEIRTSAPAQNVWAAWTDPQKIAQWFTDGAEGEPRTGTTFWWIFERFNLRIPYEVLDAVPNERFVLKGEMPGRPPGILEITIRKEGGETVMTLVNSGFQEGAQWDEEFEGIHSGWKMASAILKLYLENYFGRSKVQMLVMRPANFTPERLTPFFRNTDQLSRWLTTSGGIGAPGSACALSLQSGDKLTGTVLADTGREITLGWKEIDGTLELKAFSMGPEMRMICLRALSWNLESDRANQIEIQMAQALDRLAAAL
jgi:uncharacterized protein YndB with AHSA1/START domain